jgi:hypothetical protein
VTSDRTGAAELVSENDAGFVVPARNPDALAASMRALLEPELRARLGGNARSAALPLSPAAMTLKLVLLYKDMLEASVAHRMAARAAREAANAAPAEAPPLHGEFGLDSETLPHAPHEGPPPPAKPRG